MNTISAEARHMRIFAGDLGFAKYLKLISTLKNSNSRLLISLGACSDSVDFFLSEKC